MHNFSLDSLSLYAFISLKEVIFEVSVIGLSGAQRYRVWLLMKGGGFGVVFIRAISRRKAKGRRRKKERKGQSSERRVGAFQKFKKQRDAKMKSMNHKVQKI